METPGNGHTETLSPAFQVKKPDPVEWMEMWPYVRQGLEHVKKNTPTVTWIPEQNSGGCEFFFCVEEGKGVIGFYIMLPQMDPWLNCALSWLCWIVYSSDHGIIDRIEPLAMEQARQRGFSEVRFITAQPRIVQHMRARGWRAVETVCRKVVDY
jgi:hypothetical protein